MNDFDLKKYLAEGKLLKEDLAEKAESLEMNFMDPRNKFGSKWQKEVADVLVRKYDGRWENWINDNPKELEMLLNKFDNLLKEGKLLKEVDDQSITSLSSAGFKNLGGNYYYKFKHPFVDSNVNYVAYLAANEFEIIDKYGQTQKVFNNIEDMINHLQTHVELHTMNENSTKTKESSLSENKGENDELVAFLNSNVEAVKQHMRDEFFDDDEDEAEYNEEIGEEIDSVTSFEGADNDDDLAGAVPSQVEIGISYMLKDDYDALEDKTRFETDNGFPPADVKVAGRDLKFITYSI
ncbi:hypothetical protein N9P60_00190 [bacterium]|nr:hypothetical protein [bacterium]MDB4319846.1 hypothetical protein [bacterium]